MPHELKLAAQHCTACDLHHHRRHSVWGGGSLSPEVRVLVVGDQPSRQDNATGDCFSGQPGAILRAGLDHVGLTSDRVWLTTLTKCWAPSRPTSREAKTCAARYLLPLLTREDGWDLIVGVGAESLRYLTGQPGSQAFGVVSPTRIRTGVGRGSGSVDGGCGGNFPATLGLDTPTFGLVHPAWVLRNTSRKHVFEQQINALGRLLNPPEVAPKEYELIEQRVDSRGLWQEMAQALKGGSGPVAMDLETTSLSRREGTILGVSLSHEAGRAWYITDPELFTPTFSLLAGLGRGVVMHNAKFDLGWVQSWLGAPWLVRFEDTLVMADHLGLADKGLKHLALSELGIPMDRYETWDGTDPTYPCLDADATLQLFHNLDRRDYNREAYQADLDLIPLLLAMEDRGLPINRERAAAYHERLSYDYGETKYQLEEAAGLENVQSPKQLGALLAEWHGKYWDKLTPSGGIPTGSEYLEPLAERDPWVAELLRMRKVKKILGYLETILFFSQTDGRLHPNIKEDRAASGRLRTGNARRGKPHPDGLPNLNVQNFPKPTTDPLTRVVRSVVEPPPGRVLGRIDYGALELRILADIVPIPQLISEFKKPDADPHRRTAEVIFGPGVTKEQRSIGKLANFAVVYGASPATLAARAGLSVSEATEVLNLINTQMNMDRYRQRVVQQLTEQGFVETRGGRRRYLWDIHSVDKAKRQAAIREGANHIIQGTAADLLRLAMLACEARGIPGLLLQIHDELLWEWPVPEARRLLYLAQQTMTGIPLLHHVPLVVDAELIPYWAEPIKEGELDHEFENEAAG